MTTSVLAVRCILMLITAAILLLNVSPAGAVTITVNTTSDSGASAFSCTLREALSVASGNSEPGCVGPGIPGSADTINVTASGTLTLTGGPLSYGADETLTIDGNGLTVDANDITRVMSLLNGDVTIREMIFTGGNSAIDGGGLWISTGSGVEVELGAGVVIEDNSADLEGGGVYVFGADTVLRVTDGAVIRSNTSAVDGGGIYAEGGAEVFISDGAVIDENICIAFCSGGGIYAGSGVELTVFGGAQITGNMGGVGGGGIFASSDAGLVTVRDPGTLIATNTADLGGGIYVTNDLVVSDGVEITGNSAGVFGGGIVVIDGDLTLEDGVQVTGNSAASGGGGIYMDGANVDIENSLVADNTGAFPTGMSAVAFSAQITNSTFSGNTVYLQNSGTNLINLSTFVSHTASEALDINPLVGATTVRNTIIANTTGGDACKGSAGTYTNTLVQNNDDCPVINGLAGNIVGADPLLADLADNGGLTMTRALLRGSPAINAGNNTLIPLGITTDQRGAGFPRINNTTADMGAHESLVGSLTVTLNLQARPAPPNSQWVITGNYEFRPVGGGAGSAIVQGVFTTNMSGQFAVTGLIAGTYDFWVKGDHTLAQRHTITLNGGSNAFTPDQLPEGDANDNNGVTLVDFSLLAASFGTSPPNPSFNPQADFNEDKQISLPDFSLMASNFGQQGDS